MLYVGAVSRLPAALASAPALHVRSVGNQDALRKHAAVATWNGELLVRRKRRSSTEPCLSDGSLTRWVLTVPCWAFDRPGPPKPSGSDSLGGTSISRRFETQPECFSSSSSSTARPRDKYGAEHAHCFFFKPLLPRGARLLLIARDKDSVLLLFFGLSVFLKHSSE